MAKTTTSGMDTHLLSEVTTLAMAVVIERTDGQKFRLTTSSEDIKLDIGDGDGEQTYSASEGVGRTNIESDSELNVDNLDIVGIFDNVILKETELRRGLFDFADFKIFVFNHQNTADGIIKIFRGQLGEVITVPRGWFQVTVRSLVQVYSKETGEVYSKDCRADLGDIRCTVPILPDVVPRDTSLALGDFYIASPSLETVSNATMLVHGQNGAEDTGTYGGTPSFGTQAAVQTVVTKYGPAAIEFSPSGAVDPSQGFVGYGDPPAIGTQEFTIEGWIRFKSNTSVQTFFGKYLNTGNQREWFFRYNQTSGFLDFLAYSDGSTNVINRQSAAFTPTVGQWYHVAVTRDAAGDVRMFIDGTLSGTNVNYTGTIFDGTATMYLGKLRSAGFNDQPFDGFIEDFRFTVGAALYTANFTPPTESLKTIQETIDGLIWEDYQDRIYEVTTAGTSDPIVQPAYDTGIGNTTTDGTAVLTANNSWMRFAQVTAVGANPRRDFTVTELTPNSGQAVGSNRTPSSLGFPDDWFNGGAVYFETGDNAGVAKEVRDFVADDGVTIEQDITTLDQFPFDVQVGDKLRIFPGCDKLNATCISKFNNGINFVGEPYVPGEDVLGQYPDAR